MLEPHAAASLFVTLTVYEVPAPAAPDCEVGLTLTVGAARVQLALMAV